MFGITDHERDPGTGRPQPHSQWPAQAFCCFCWGTIALIGFVFGLLDWVDDNWRSDSWVVPSLGAVFGLLGLFQWRELRQKKRVLREATKRYHWSIENAVDEM